MKRAPSFFHTSSQVGIAALAVLVMVAWWCIRDYGATNAQAVNGNTKSGFKTRFGEGEAPAEPLNVRVSARREPRPPRSEATSSGNGTKPSGEEPAAIDLSQTSWQNPFSASLWQSKGWTFDGKSMTSTAGKAAEARFRRSYRKLMLGMRIEPSAESATFYVRIEAPATRSTSKITISNGEVVVLGQNAKHAPRILKRRKLDLTMAPGKPGMLSLSATGNRMQIVWNGRRLLTCDQPADQSGRDLEFIIGTNQNGIRLTDLRIEGE